MSIGKTLGSLFSTIWSLVDGFRKIIHLIIMLFIFSIIISALMSSSATIPGSAALLIQPAGRLVDQLAGDPFERALDELMGGAEEQTLVQDIVDGLEFAKDDDRITSVVLDLSAMPGGGLSKLRRIGDAIDDFQESGKKVIAKANFYSQGSYYLASRADEVYMHPDGVLILSGFGAYLNFYKSALDKLKIDWNIFRVGTYKAAVEPYMRDDMSPAYRESLGYIIDQLWSQYTADIETARNIEAGTIDNILENLIETVQENDDDFAKLALAAGLVDGLVTREELQKIIVDIAGSNGDDGEYPTAALGDYLQQMRLLHGGSVAEENVAVIVAAGTIMNGTQPPGTIGGESTAKLLRQARNDDSVKAVVFRIDSGGGSAFASEIILNEVLALKAAGKPVVVSMSSVAASGGYWVSMAADSIYASPSTITGSIGIFGMFPTFQRSFDELGITTDGIGTSIWAGALRADRALSDEAKQLFQLSIDKGYDNFISGVAEYRGMEKNVVDGIAQGRIWTGNDAFENGLIDGLGGIDTAIVAAAELAELDEDNYGLKYFEQELSPGEQLALDILAGADGLGLKFGVLSRPSSSVERVAHILDEVLAPLVMFDDPKGMYSKCFCEFE